MLCRCTRTTGSRCCGSRRSEQGGIRDSRLGSRNSESLRIAVHGAAAASGVQSGNTATERDTTRLALDFPNPQSRIPNPGPQMRELIPLRQAHAERSEEHTSDLHSLLRISYAVFCFKNKIKILNTHFITKANSAYVTVRDNLPSPL